MNQVIKSQPHVEIVKIETAQLYAKRTEQLQHLLSQQGGVEIDVSANYKISIATEAMPTNQDHYAATISLETLFDGDKEPFAFCALVVVFTNEYGLEGLSEKEKAGRLALAAYPYARGKVHALLSEVGFPAELPYQPPVFTIS